MEWILCMMQFQGDGHLISPPLQGAFVASVSEELHLVSVVLGIAPRLLSLSPSFSLFSTGSGEKTFAPTVKGPVTGEPKYITG